jgi:HEAT repeat protein/protein-S-isoprenylcysteine O-methyltransferase Ste14
MLPVFAQFAGVMFFLAGLGILNALWLPVLDVSYGFQDWGLVVRAPSDFLRWLLALVGIPSFWPTVVFFTAAGILIFLLGSYAWLTARARGKGVADFWIYRISRHPQYLGWILWTYGAFLLIQRMRYPKRSWGIGASLPFLISTMVIVAVALIEELNMRKAHGEAYEEYRRSAPFLFPVPRFIESVFSFPYTVLFGKERPERRREVVAVVGLFTLLLMGISALFYAGGAEKLRRALRSEEHQALVTRELTREMVEETNARRQRHLASMLGEQGEAAVAPLLEVMNGGDPHLWILAAGALERIRSEEAIPALTAGLSSEDENVRSSALGALRAMDQPIPVATLIPLLEDPAFHIRVGALEALADRGAPEFLEWGGRLLTEFDGRVRAGVVDVLGGAGSPGAIPLLAGLLSDDSEWVRREAVIALIRIGSPEISPALREALSDQDWEVRLYAQEGLKRMGRG